MLYLPNAAFVHTEKVFPRRPCRQVGICSTGQERVRSEGSVSPRMVVLHAFIRRVALIIGIDKEIGNPRVVIHPCHKARYLRFVYVSLGDLRDSIILFDVKIVERSRPSQRFTAAFSSSVFNQSLVLSPDVKLEVKLKGKERYSPRLLHMSARA